MPTALVLPGIIVAAVIVAVIIFKLMWRVAEPNEALRAVSQKRHEFKRV